MNRPLKGFITYAQKNTTAKDELIMRLDVMQQQNKLVTWHDAEMIGGDKWREEIFKHLADSDILLYLVSAASLASKNCNKELAEAISSDIRIIPIILEDCDWQNHQLSDFQAFPDRGLPINEWQPESKGWQNVVTSIREAVEEMQTSVPKETLPKWVFQQGNFLLALEQTEKAIEAYSHAIKLDPNYAYAYNNRGIAYAKVGKYNRAIEEYKTAIQLKPDYAHAYNNRAAAYTLTGEFDRSLKDYSRAIQLRPNYVEAYSNRGATYVLKGDIDCAIADYTEAMRLNPEDAEAYSSRGIAYEKKGDIDRAIADYTKAIQLNPKDAVAYGNRGVIYYNKGKSAPAIADYTEAVKLNPNDAVAYNNRGIAYGEAGEFNRAIEDFNRATELKQEYAEAYNNRGVAYSRRGDSNRAIIDLTKAIELKSNYADAYNNRGFAYNRKGEYDHAIADFNKAIQLNPDDANTYNNRGVAYDGKDESDKAIEDYNRAIQLKPNYANAYNGRGVAYSKKGEVDRAIVNFNKAIQLKSDYADAYSNRGNAYHIKGEPNRAIEDYTKAIELKSDYADAYNNRGVTYNGKGEYDHAIADFNKAIQFKSDYTDAYNNRGLAYKQKNEFDKAIEDYTRAIDLNFNYVDAYNNRGIAYYAKGKFDKAIEDYTKAINLNPDHANAYNNRGLAYYAKNNHVRAVEDYTKAIDLNPDHANAYNNRGAAYTNKGEFAKAIENYTKTIDLNPDHGIAYKNRGKVWLHLREWKQAQSDLIAARDLGMDIIASFHNDYESVEAYERRNRVKLPADIAAMLTERRRIRFPKTQESLPSDDTPLESPDVLNLLAKLRSAGTLLSQYVQTRPTFGIKTDRSGAFVVDSATRDQLIAEHPASADILKPFLHGRDIKRWQVAKPDSWLIFTYRRIEINRYPAIRKHLEKYRSSLRKRAGKQKWYELPATRSDAEHFVQTKLICPNSYDHQTFAVDTEGFYCGDTCYLIPTEETWLCGLLNSRAVEWFYSQASKQLTGDYLRARSRYMQQIPIPDLTSAQKSQIDKIVDYLIFLQGQPTTSSGDLAHARDFIMLKYFERIIDGLVYEAYLGEELHQGQKHFFKPLLDERLPQLEEIRGDKMSALQEIFERLYERTHPVRRNLFFLDSVKPIRIIEDKA